jgi:hypothetical protein
MVKIVKFSIVNSANIDNTNRGVSKILIGWLTPLNGNTMQMSE